MSELDRRMRVVLLRLEMLSSGSVTAWNKSGGASGEPDDRIVDLVLREEKPLHDYWREKYDEQTSDSRRERVVREAEDVVASWVRRQAPADDAPTKSFEEILLEDGEGWPAEWVAQKFGVAPAFVRRIRERHSRGTEDGTSVVAPVEDPAARARELRAAGLTTRQIALTIGCHQTQVMRWIHAEN